MQDGIELPCLEETLEEVLVADVAFMELESALLAELIQVIGASGARQVVQDRDRMSEPEKSLRRVSSYETTTASNKNLHRLACMFIRTGKLGNPVKTGLKLMQ
jgi:predicted nicotinamide N-methyase